MPTVTKFNDNRVVWNGIDFKFLVLSSRRVYCCDGFVIKFDTEFSNTQNLKEIEIYPRIPKDIIKYFPKLIDHGSFIKKKTPFQWSVWERHDLVRELKHREYYSLYKKLQKHFIWLTDFMYPNLGISSVTKKPIVVDFGLFEL